MATGTNPVRLHAPTFEPSQTENLPLEERIRRRANEIWLQNGSPTGTDLVDWLEAESEILEEQR